MVVQPQPKTYTLDEYRALEEIAEGRSEYDNGTISPMIGGTINHNRIVRNLLRMLDIAFQGQPYEVFPSDLRLWIPKYHKGTYPDVMAIAGEPAFHQGRTDEVLNPCLLIEVLSKSTEMYDRGNKFLYYRSIPEFQEYLLIGQTEFCIEHYIKTGKTQWTLNEHWGENGKIMLKSVNTCLAIAEIYEGVDFSLTE